MALSGIFCRHGRDLLRPEGLHTMFQHNTKLGAKKIWTHTQKNKGHRVIQKKETQQHWSRSMRTCIAVYIVYHFSLDLFAPTNTTTKVSESLVTERSRTAAITTKHNHMWTKASVCVRHRKRHAVQVNLHPATK